MNGLLIVWGTALAAAEGFRPSPMRQQTIALLFAAVCIVLGLCGAAWSQEQTPPLFDLGTHQSGLVISNPTTPWNPFDQFRCPDGYERVLRDNHGVMGAGCARELKEPIR